MMKRIWIPEYQVPEKEIIELPPVKLGGYFYVDLIDAKTGEIKQHLEFPNLITDKGLDFIGQGTSLDTLYNLLAVGTGSTTPAVSDTTLEAQVASTTSDGGIADFDSTSTSPEFSFRRRARVFLGGVANASLTELGWLVGGVIANRALFKDLACNLTTIEKTKEDILRVVYEYRIFAPLNDVTGTIGASDLATSSIAYTIRPQNVNQNNGWPNLLDNMGDYSTPEARVHETSVLGSRTGDNNPSPQASETTSSFAPYTLGSFFRDMEYKWTPPNGNFSSQIGLITWNPWNTSGDLMLWQMHLSQSIEKEINNTLRITFRQRWTRVDI